MVSMELKVAESYEVMKEQIEVIGSRKLKTKRDDLKSYSADEFVKIYGPYGYEYSSGKEIKGEGNNNEK